MNGQMAPVLAAQRVLRTLVAAGALAMAACAHAPPSQRPAANGEGPRADARDEQPARAFVTGSRLPQPVGRFGVPLGVSAVKIYYWRGDPARLPFPLGLGQSLPSIDLDRQPDENATAQPGDDTAP